MRKLLLVIDYQNDFVDGSLGFEKSTRLEEGIIQLVKQYEKEEQDIIFTLDTHQEDYLNSVEGRNLPVLHCVEGTNGHRIYGKLYPYSLNHLNICKDTFGSKDLFLHLLNHHYEEIAICGVVTNICVIANAVIVKSALPNSKIMIVQDLCASYDQKLHDMSLEILKNLHIELVDSFSFN